MKRRNITDAIVIHCSATPEGRDNSAADIRGWHKARGFEDIGYHYVVRLDGTVESGRREDLEGAHCRENGMNRRSLGICYVGGMSADMRLPKDTRTEAQNNSLKALVKNLQKKYSIPDNRVFGHRDFARKACPSFDVRTLFMTLLAFMIVTMSSCTRTVYVPVETAHRDMMVSIDTVSRKLWRVDTVIDRDTVRLESSGDTIYKEVSRWRFRYREHTDTIYRDRNVYTVVSDSISITNPPLDSVSYSKNREFRKIFLLIVVFAIFCIIIVRRLRIFRS